MEKNKTNQICRAKIEVVEGQTDFDFICIAAPVNNGQVMRSYENDEYFVQVLLPTAENTRVGRLNSGLNMFDNHTYDKSAVNTLGISVGYEFTERGLELKCKWGARADEALRSDVANGIIKTVSIEGEIFEYTITREANKLPEYKATDWEPTSLSFAPVPQDIESQIEVKRQIADQIKPKIKNSLITNLKSKFK